MGTRAWQGVETTVPVRSVTQEIKILFPAVEDVKIGTLESSDAEGNLTAETSVILYLREELSEEETGRMEQWLNEVYDGTCHVIYITETEKPA